MAARKRAKKQTGSGASSAAARLRAMIRNGRAVFLMEEDTIGKEKMWLAKANITRSVQKIAASCLSQDEIPRRRRA